jgi:hypothetical protein
MKEQRTSGIGAIATKYGLILGILAFVVFLATILTGIQRNWLSTAVITVLVIVLMVLAHQEFKKSHDGMLTYGQALGTGTLLSVVAAVVRDIFMYVYVRYINTGFFAAAARMQRAALEKRGITGEQAQHAMSLTAPLMTPVGLVVVSLITGVIGGFVVALIVSIFTQKSDGASDGSRPLG